MDYPEGHMEDKSPPQLEVVFDTFDSNQEKSFFPKRALFNKASDPRMLYLSKIGSDEINFDWV